MEGEIRMQKVISILKSKPAISIGSFLLGILVVMVAMKVMAPSMMIHERVSPLGFEETVERIQQNAEALGWSVTKIYNFQEAIMAKGLGDVGRIKVLELCQPHYAYGLLEDGNNKFVSVMMPCAIAVYEKEDGSVYVSSMNVGFMGKIFGGGIDEAMSKVAGDDKKILSFLKE